MDDARTAAGHRFDLRISAGDLTELSRREDGKAERFETLFKNAGG